MSYSYDEIYDDIVEFIENFYEFDEENDVYEDYADFLLTELAETFRPKLLEKDFERTGNVLFLWEAIEHCIKKNVPLTEYALLYLRNAGNKLTSEDFPADATRYMLICDEMKLTGQPPPFGQYEKEKHKRLYLATYYWLLISEVRKTGTPETDSRKNKIKKNCRLKAAVFFKYKDRYDERTYFNWVKDSEFIASDFLIYFQTKNYQISLSPSNSYIQGEFEELSSTLLIEILKDPDQHFTIIDSL